MEQIRFLAEQFRDAIEQAKENENIPETTLQNHLEKILNGVGKATHQQEKVHG